MTGGGTGMQEVKEIALAGATGPLGQIIQRAVPPVVSAVKQGAQRLTTPTQVATKVEPTMGAGMVEPLPPAGTVTPTPPVTTSVPVVVLVDATASVISTLAVALVALVNGKRLERLEAQRCDLDLLPALFC